MRRSRWLALALIALPQLAFAQSDVAPVPEHTAPDRAVPIEVRDLVERIETDLDAWDVQGAHAALEQLQQRMSAPEAAQGLSLMQAKVAFYEGRYAEAVKLYKQAGAEDRAGGYRRLAEDALAQSQGDALQKSAHFDLYYPNGTDAVLAPYALDTLEKAYTALQQDFDFTPPGRIRVEVLPDDETLAKLSTLTVEQIRTTGTIAICKFNRLMIISPRALVHGYDWRDTLNHELVHFVVSMKSRNSVPIWLHEGLAKFEETRWRGAGGQAMTPDTEYLLGQAVHKGKLITFEQMHPSMALLPSAKDAATAFAEVFHAIEFLKQKGGTAMWNAIIANLKAGDEYPEAVSKAYGAGFPKFVTDWKGYLASRKYPAHPPGAAPELEFKHGADQKKQDAVAATDLVDFQDVRDPSARKFAHLGSLLLQRRHVSAAVEEFGKAYAKSADSRQLASQYALALLASNELPLAKKVLAESIQRDPSYELTQVYMGEVLLKLGDAAGAREHFLTGVNTDPFDPRLHAGLVEVYGALKQPELVKQEQKALEILGAKSQANAGPVISKAQLMLATHPFAEVMVDGQPLGRTTPTVLELAPGKHHLVLTNAERGLKKELDLELGPGESRELRIDLDKPAQPPDAAPATR